MSDFEINMKNNPIKNYHDDIIEGETLDKDQNKKDEL